MLIFVLTVLKRRLSALARPHTVLAGGTDFYPARVGRAIDEDVLDIGGIAVLRGIAPSQGWRLGATTTWSELLEADLPPLFDGLKQAAREVGGRQIQNAGTLAGNLCNASPAADGVPCLLALDAEVEIAGPVGRRRLPLRQFITGVRRTALAPGELVVAIHVPRPGHDARSAFLKLGARRYLVISIAMAAATLEIADGRVAAARIAVGACSPVAERLPALEAALAGAPLDGLADRVEVAHLAPLSPDRRRARQRGLSQRRRRHRAAPPAGRLRAMKVAFTLNGQAAAWNGPPVTRLASALRDDLGLTGTKIGCDAGDCGACTVLLDGGRSAPASSPMGQVEGRAVETVEGLGDGNGALTASAEILPRPWRRPVRHLHARHADGGADELLRRNAAPAAPRSRTRWAACSAAAPATARSSMPSLAAGASRPGPAPAAPAPPSARACRGSTACPR